MPMCGADAVEERYVVSWVYVGSCGEKVWALERLWWRLAY